MTNDTRIVCPDCGGDKFSIVYTQVGTGPVVEFGDDHRDIEIHDTGHIIDSDEDVFCVHCEAERHPDDLVTQEEYDDPQ
jgi:hypothetical protein